MTKEQAITRIKHSSMYIDDKETADYIIKALEQPTMDKAMIHILTKENDELKAEIGRLRQSLEQQPSEDCVSRQEVIKALNHHWLSGSCSRRIIDEQIDKVKALPSVTPTHGTCKNCKHWKDSDGVYRRGINAESKCPLNILQVFDGDFYCADFEKRGNENGN